jgi:hypothetical protein
MAEIVKVMRGGTGASLSEQSRMWVRAAGKRGQAVTALAS